MGRTLYISPSGIQQSQYPYSPIQRSIYSPITSQLSLGPTIEIDLDLSNVRNYNGERRRFVIFMSHFADRRVECRSIKKPIIGLSVPADTKINLYTDNPLFATHFISSISTVSYKCK